MDDGANATDPAEPEEPRAPPPDPVFDAYHARLAAELPGRVVALREQLADDLDQLPYLGHRSRNRARKAEAALERVLPTYAAISLAWLAAHQFPDGSWSADGFADACGKLGKSSCRGWGIPRFYDVGVTGLALLAFLRADRDLVADDAYGPALRRGLDWLAFVQEEDGMLGRDGRIMMFPYNHMVATLALAEATALPDGDRWRDAATRAAAAVPRLRSPGPGWRYADPTSDEMLEHPSDVSVTGWAVQALVAARDAGIPIEEDALAAAFLFIDAMTDGDGQVGYFERGGGSARVAGSEFRWPAAQTQAMTSAGVLCRQLIDPGMDIAGNEDAVLRGIHHILRLPPIFSKEKTERGRVDYYSFYYGSRALAARDRDTWSPWRLALIETFTAHGMEDADAVGSWDPEHGPWGGDGGRVYSTAIMTLAALAQPDETPSTRRR